MRIKGALSDSLSWIRSIFEPETKQDLKICVLGASLSAQTVNHKTGEVTGYVEAFRRKYSADFGVEDNGILQFAYGGNRLSDAGLIRLEELIRTKPDICILEPFVEDDSRGKDASTEVYIYVFQELLKAGIVPVVFGVPLPVTKNVALTARVKNCLEVCNRFNIPLKIVDLNLAIEQGITFNGLHTEREGANYLAAELRDFLENTDIKQQLNILKKTIKFSPSSIVIKELDETCEKAYRRLVIVYQAKVNTNIVLLQKQNIGPFSPVLKVTISASDNGTYNATAYKSVWDRHCFYQRSSFVTLCDVDSGLGEATLTVEISDRQPKYSECSKHSGSWPELNERKLVPIGPLVALTDDNVEVLSVTYT